MQKKQQLLPTKSSRRPSKRQSNWPNCEYWKMGANCKWASAHLARDCLLLDKLVHNVIDGLPVVPDVRQRHLIGLIRNLLDLHNRQHNKRISAAANVRLAGSSLLSHLICLKELALLCVPALLPGRPWQTRYASAWQLGNSRNKRYEKGAA